jgi:hypothetical protein
MLYDAIANKDDEPWMLNSLRHLSVLCVSAVSVFERSFTTEAQVTRRLRREKLKFRTLLAQRESLRG